MIMLDKTIKKAYSIDAAIPNSQKLYNAIAEKLQKYTAFKEELVTIWHLIAVYMVPLVDYSAQPVLFQTKYTKV
jgi:hypothetical protein